MNKIKFISRWVFVVGIIITIIGIIHSSFAPIGYQQMMKDETLKDKARGFVYFFAFGGFAIIFAGLLTIYSSLGLKKSERWAWLIALSSTLFVAIGMIGAVTFAKFGNPMIYVASISSILSVFLLLLFYRNFKNRS
jgi:small-conductance mechanosensitive channel